MRPAALTIVINFVSKFTPQMRAECSDAEQRQPVLGVRGRADDVDGGIGEGRSNETENAAHVLVLSSPNESSQGIMIQSAAKGVSCSQ